MSWIPAITLETKDDRDNVTNFFLNYMPWSYKTANIHFNNYFKFGSNSKTDIGDGQCIEPNLNLLYQFPLSRIKFVMLLSYCYEVKMHI